MMLTANCPSCHAGAVHTSVRENGDIFCKKEGRVTGNVTDLGLAMPEPDPVLDMTVVTTLDVPGYRIARLIGLVFGVVVVSRNVFSDLGAGMKSTLGGELRGYTRVLQDGRKDAVNRLRQEAHDRGANAVIGMGFDSGDFPFGAQVVAFGTAVVVEPDDRQGSTG